MYIINVIKLFCDFNDANSAVSLYLLLLLVIMKLAAEIITHYSDYNG